MLEIAARYVRISKLTGMLCDDTLAPAVEDFGLAILVF